VDQDPALNTQETYFYWLEAVDVSGATESYGPVSAQLEQSVQIVQLRSFTATGATRSITLGWETAAEFDNLGFNLYRAESEDGERAQINGELIQSLGAAGALYDYVDDDNRLRKRVTYFYWLEAVNTQGRTELYGSVSAQLEG
jgi:hypothetical protein